MVRTFTPREAQRRRGDARFEGRASARSTHLARRRSIAGLALAPLLVLGAAAAGGASPRTLRAAPAKADFAYFAGKSITFVTPGAAGGLQQLAAQILASGIASYLHCSVNVEDIPAGGSIPAQDDVADAAPNGLTIGWLGAATDVLNPLQNIPGINFNLRTQVILAGIPGPNYALISRVGDGYPTIASVLRSKAAFNEINASNGQTDVSSLVFSAAYRLKSHFIYGYANANAELAGFLRGDGALVWSNTSSAESVLVAKQGIALVQSPAPQKSFAMYPELKNVPTVAQLLASDPPKTKAGVAAVREDIAILNDPLDILFAPTGTPARLALALTDAAKSTLAQAPVKADEITIGQSPGYLSPAQASADIDSMVAHAPILARFLQYQYP